jgi:hypothetical protein
LGLAGAVVTDTVTVTGINRCWDSSKCIVFSLHTSMKN